MTQITEPPVPVRSRLSTLGVVARLMRDPLSALPPEVYDAPEREQPRPG